MYARQRFYEVCETFSEMTRIKAAEYFINAAVFGWESFAAQKQTGSRLCENPRVPGGGGNRCRANHCI